MTEEIPKLLCLCGMRFEIQKWHGGKCPDCGLVWDFVEAYRPELTPEMEAAVVKVAREGRQGRARG